ncbi:MAG: PKD domain-containing protein, partial [Ginsengibacter sp.]
MKNLERLTIIYAQAIFKKFALLVVLSSVSFFANAQLRADFAATPVTGCAPLIVNFSDFSSGNPSYWKWDLGDGTTSFLQNPSATYFDPGQYNIKLIIKNSQGLDSIIKSRFINVYASPVVDFSTTLQSGCMPLNSKFTDLTTTESGNISGWEWDFGDGEFSTNQNPTHNYLASGTYNISLRATNNFGCVSSATKPNYIKVYSGVKAGFENSVPATCNQPATINFTNSSTGNGVLSYVWSFGDSAISTLINPSHTYTVGTYDVSLVLFNSNGCSDTLKKHNAITLQSVKADFSAASMVCQGSNVNFENASVPLPSGASWNFGDGTFSASINPIKIFANPGNFNVKMIAGFGACKDSITKPIQVIAKPNVNFTANTTISCSAPFTVNFTHITSQGNTFYWDFGDGSSSSLPNPAHTYLKEGFYTVKLVFTNNSGCADSLVKKDFIQIKSPVASINNLPQKGCGPLTHAFSAGINSIDSVISYKWDFGDGTFASSMSPTHAYTNPGSYTVTLFYSTISGCTDTVKFVNGILVGSKPGTNFSATPRDVCAVTQVNFTDLSTGNPDQWLWLFGDGSSSITENP